MTRVIQRHLYHTDVTKRTTVEDEFTVPSGHTLRVDRFTGGIEYSEKETRVELVWRDGGDTTVAVAYGSSFQLDIGADFVGGADTKLVIRHVNNDSGTLNMAAWWEGVTYV